MFRKPYIQNKVLTLLTLFKLFVYRQDLTTVMFITNMYSLMF